MNLFKKHKNISLIVRLAHKNLNPSQLLSSGAGTEVELSENQCSRPVKALCVTLAGIYLMSYWAKQ